MKKKLILMIVISAMVITACAVVATHGSRLSYDNNSVSVGK